MSETSDQGLTPDEQEELKRLQKLDRVAELCGTTLAAKNLERLMELEKRQRDSGDGEQTARGANDE